MPASTLNCLLERLAADPRLWRAEAYAARVEALDQLELLTMTAESARAEADLLLAERAVHMMERLETANRRLVEDLHGAIAAGTCRGAAARAAFERLGGCGAGKLRVDEGGYDALDVLAAQLFLGSDEPAPAVELPSDSVPYQPTPARHILALLDRVALCPDDLFCDLGSGLGHVCLMVNLLCGARARGIEIDPAYCGFARARSTALGLTGVEFVTQDVGTASLAEGTCYFLYTPTMGETLAHLLDRLAGESRERPIIVAAHGPCVAELKRRWPEWLFPSQPSELAIFSSSLA